MVSTSQLALELEDRRPSVRFDFDALVELWQRRSPGGSLDQLRRQLQINGPAWKRIQREGLTVAQADRFAVRLGLHPCELWPSWWG